MTKKEMKDAYKLYKPDMGVFAFVCKTTNKAYLGCGQNVKADINGLKFRLKLGNFSSNTKCGLQNDWSKYGESNFEITILELLEYDEDDAKTDYSADLRILREFCSEKFPDFEFIHE